jgi:hypothetical protein
MSGAKMHECRTRFAKTFILLELGSSSGSSTSETKMHTLLGHGEFKKKCRGCRVIRQTLYMFSVVKTIREDP